MNMPVRYWQFLQVASRHGLYDCVVAVSSACVFCRAGDRLTYFRLPWAEPDAPSSITILYEDEHVVSKAI
jgi:hypothetical protein